MKIIERLKEKIIHRLGGYTSKDVSDMRVKALREGAEATAASFLIVANNNYGKSADEWCKLMYDYITTYYYKLLSPKK